MSGSSEMPKELEAALNAIPDAGADMSALVEGDVDNVVAEMTQKLDGAKIQ